MQLTTVLKFCKNMIYKYNLLKVPGDDVTLPYYKLNIVLMTANLIHWFWGENISITFFTHVDEDNFYN